MNRIRSTHFHAEDRYVINRNKAQYKTDPSGHFRASYTYRNETDETDHIHISVIFEEYSEPVQTLQLTVPPRSSKNTHISLKDIPSGSRIVYIIAQTSIFDLKTEQDDWNTEYAVVYYFDDILHGIFRPAGAPAFRSTRPSEEKQRRTGTADLSF